MSVKTSVFLDGGDRTATVSVSPADAGATWVTFEVGHVIDGMSYSIGEVTLFAEPEELRRVLQAGLDALDAEDAAAAAAVEA